MTRRKLIAGNWKMNGSLAALAELDAIAAAAAAQPDIDVAVAVPFTLIAPAAARVPALVIGAEDVHEADSGAHYRLRVGKHGVRGGRTLCDRRPLRTPRRSA